MNTTAMFVGLLTILVVFFTILVIFHALWNSTLPELFHWPQISLWTAFKLLLLSAILFGGIKIPMSYGNSTTQKDVNGATITTFWSFGAPSK